MSSTDVADDADAEAIMATASCNPFSFRSIRVNVHHLWMCLAACVSHPETDRLSKPDLLASRWGRSLPRLHVDVNPDGQKGMSTDKADVADDADVAKAKDFKGRCPNADRFPSVQSAASVDLFSGLPD